MWKTTEEGLGESESGLSRRAKIRQTSLLPDPRQSNDMPYCETMLSPGAFSNLDSPDFLQIEHTTRISLILAHEHNRGTQLAHPPPIPRRNPSHSSETMPVLHQWDYLFAIGTIFAGLDAFMIGANDVANSFASAPCLAAAVMEFAGAVLVGARVTSTIKDGILLGFTCAIVASSTWLTIATRASWPVSTTYSIVSAIVGVGVATGGWDAPRWGWNGAKGLAAIWAGMVIAPCLAGAFGVVLYLIVKYTVLVRKDSVKWGLITSPMFFFLVAAVLTMSIIYKGSPSLGLDDLSSTTQAIAIVMTALVVTIISILFWMPYVYATVVKKDHYSQVRQPPADAGEGSAVVPDYRIRATASDRPRKPLQKKKPFRHPSKLADEIEKYPIEGSVFRPKNMWLVIRYRAFPFMKYLLLRGLSVDIHDMQQDEHTAAAHAHAVQYPNETEHLYSFMQVMTACVSSFGHGANDVSNAIGPFSVIYHVWATGTLSGSSTPVPIWALAFGGGMLVIGLATYGYNVMKVLGNRITLMSPSRGFSMELASSITVILASQYGIPVSTTMCITGATCRRLVMQRGCLMGIILNAPHL
ncbi:sodium:inorganic phosphate symporter [Coprinopsis sp. MPI-PUGE-AT-0042]|nr:sodium:inorganic phosphate symporter [Coprinopsis sp. MPI-PUGE-AT-0042]